MRWIWIPVALVSCSKPSPAPAERQVVSVPAPAPAPAPTESAPAPVAAADACLSAEEDIAKRHEGAKPGESFDIDGNGVPDPVFKSCYSGNCDYFLYQLEGKCARFLGQITAAVIDDPRCDKPPVDGKPCRISAQRFMIHGDQQEYFYELVDGKYVEAGSGRYVPPPKKFP